MNKQKDDNHQAILRYSELLHEHGVGSQAAEAFKLQFNNEWVQDRFTYIETVIDRLQRIEKETIQTNKVLKFHEIIHKKGPNSDEAILFQNQNSEDDYLTKRFANERRKLIAKENRKKRKAETSCNLS